MTLAEKILAVMKEVSYLSKDDSVAFGNTKYKAMSEEKVTGIMHSMLTKYGIIVYPTDMVWSRVDKATPITHVDVRYRMVNADDPSDFIEVVSCGDGADTQDKGAGKAMTYAFKYMWLRTFAIPTGEDPDKISSAELDDKEAKAKEMEEKAKELANKPISKVKADSLVKKCETDGVALDKVLAKFRTDDVSKLTESQYKNIATNWNQVVELCKE